MNIALLKEAVLAGFLLVIIGSTVRFIFGRIFAADIPPVCKDWNKIYIMEIGLFLAGFIAHLFFEAVGLNRWYCTHGNACK